MTLQNWAASLARVVGGCREGGVRFVLAGALGLRMTAFLEGVRSHLSDWIRIYLRFVHDAAQQKYTAVMKTLLVSVGAGRLV